MTRLLKFVAVAAFVLAVAGLVLEVDYRLARHPEWDR